MTARKIWKLGYAQLNQTAEDAADYEEETVCAWLGTLTAEALDVENSIREAEGMELLEAAPDVDSLDTEIPYRDAICRRAMPYGVAAYLYADDDEGAMMQEMRSRFVAALAELSRVIPMEVYDAY